MSVPHEGRMLRLVCNYSKHWYNCPPWLLTNPIIRFAFLRHKCRVMRKAGTKCLVDGNEPRLFSNHGPGNGVAMRESEENSEHCKGGNQRPPPVTYEWQGYSRHRQHP